MERSGRFWARPRVSGRSVWVRVIEAGDARDASSGIQILGDWEGHLGGIPGWSTLALRDTKTGAIAVMSVNACCGSVPTLTMIGALNLLYPGTLVF